MTAPSYLHISQWIPSRAAEQHSITDRESVYHTHFCSFSAFKRWAHICNAQTPHNSVVYKYLCYKQLGEKPPSALE